MSADVEETSSASGQFLQLRLEDFVRCLLASRFRRLALLRQPIEGNQSEAKFILLRHSSQCKLKLLESLVAVFVVGSSRGGKTAARGKTTTVRRQLSGRKTAEG